MRFLFLAIAFLASAQTLFSQNFALEKAENEWAEPIFEDNISDFGASPGTMEVNYLHLLARSGNSNFSGQGFELEATIADRLGIETEFQTFSGQETEGRNAPRQYGMELAAQYLLRQTEKRVWAAGIGLENQYTASSPETEAESIWETGQFLVFAQRWDSGLGLQLRQRFAMEFPGDFSEMTEFETEPSFGLDGALLWQRDFLTAGFEFSAEQEESATLNIAPQIIFSHGNLMLGLGWQLPVFEQQNSNPAQSWLARLVYELE